MRNPNSERDWLSIISPLKGFLNFQPIMEFHVDASRTFILHRICTINTPLAYQVSLSNTFYHLVTYIVTWWHILSLGNISYAWHFVVVPGGTSKIHVSYQEHVCHIMSTCGTPGTCAEHQTEYWHILHQDVTSFIKMSHPPSRWHILLLDGTSWFQSDTSSL